ncbi:MAG: hypothetical protein QM802_18375 [Agriterribacter sp.]
MKSLPMLVRTSHKVSVVPGGIIRPAGNNTICSIDLISAFSMNMKNYIITLLLVLIGFTVHAQSDTAQMLLGTWVREKKEDKPGGPDVSTKDEKAHPHKVVLATNHVMFELDESDSIVSTGYYDVRGGYFHDKKNAGDLMKITTLTDSTLVLNVALTGIDLYGAVYLRKIKTPAIDYPKQ